MGGKVMQNGFLILNEKDWEKMSQAQKEWATYNTLCGIDSRLKKLEKKKFFDKVYSFAGGIVGGAASVLGIKSLG